MLKERKKGYFVFGLLITAFIMVYGSFAPQVAVAQTSIPTTAAGYDVVVIGSEIQGVLLAREAKNLGLKVMILDPRSKPGGELIQGQMFFLDDVNDNKKRSLVQGEMKDLFTAYKAGSIRKKEDFEKYFNKVIKGIPLKSGIVIDAVATVPSSKDKALKTLTYHSKDGTQTTIQSKYWVENTDFNALSSHLQVKRIPGMESIYKGKQADYMAATYMLNFKNVDWNRLHQAILEDYPLTNVRNKYGPNTYVDWNFATGFSNITNKFKADNSDLKLRGLNATNQKNGQVIINGLLIYNVNPADPKSVQSAITKARAAAPSILAFLRSNIPGFSKAELNGFPEYLYIRDYNRHETNYVLEYSDLMNGTMFWDNVSIGGYSIDLQGTKTIPTGIGFGKPDRYGLPLRSFELKSYDNVLVVGKNVGANIKAYGSARIMPTTALAAQTIGIILGKESKRLADLTPADFERIHKYLEKDYKITLKK
ncbi:FAD-dependent oxidoreductase [Paenibacillus sp. FSL K6-3166]|uniref:FAD-dependent oxidoreductase n=1 Tax=unclassified Paenibacillus TaxID=185978 RepID=UPI000B9FE086|nr:FAD-dependent oxidoreductase [Paenibacillus sp. VTT E-133291]OZQ95047.1 FAD-dependent oxidoreductase [Paenibacillus sp. VTT E-133291]